MNDRPAYAPVFESTYRLALEMQPEDQARLMMACCAYVFDGEEPELDGMLGAIFEQVAKPSIDRNLERMRRNQKIAETRRSGTADAPESDQKGTTPAPDAHQADTRAVPDSHQSAPEADKTNDQGPMTNPSPKEGEGGSKGGGAPLTPAPERFVPPSLDEARAYGLDYCRQKGYPPGVFDAEDFCDHWQSKGWKRGRTPMKDWRATLREWIRRDYRESPNAGKEEADDPLNVYDFDA